MRVVNCVASHILVCGLVPRNLNHLHRAEHRNPDHLKRSPDGEDQGETILGDDTAEIVVDYITLQCLWRRKKFDIWSQGVNGVITQRGISITYNKSPDE
jgi:hypothetical protein